jgi:hypothetical protein
MSAVVRVARKYLSKYIVTLSDEKMLALNCNNIIAEVSINKEVDYL